MTRIVTAHVSGPNERSLSVFLLEVNNSFRIIFIIYKE